MKYFNECCNKISNLKIYTLYTLYIIHYTLDSFGNDPEKIQNSIVRELEKIFKWLDVNKQCLNVTKSKFMIFQMPQKRVPQQITVIQLTHRTSL